MDYNTQREKLVMPEYGRAVQDMVDYAMTIEDRDKRNQCARTIISVMANMFPQSHDQPDFKHKLWDHLAMISDFKLDIDYPFEVSTAKHMSEKPEPVPYPTHKIHLRHYGYLLESLLDKLSEMPEGEEREELTQLVADQMKRSLFTWNRDALNEQKIADDIERYTDGRIKINLDEMKLTNCQGSGLPKSQHSNNQSKGKRSKKKY